MIGVQEVQSEIHQKLRHDLLCARLSLYRWMASGVLIGAGGVLLWQRFT